MLGVISRFGTSGRVLARSVRTTNSCQRYTTSAAPEQPTPNSSADWDKKLLHFGEKPSDLIFAPGSSHIGKEQFALHEGGRHDTDVVERLGFPFVPQEMHIPFDKLGELWGRHWAGLNDHWEGEYVSACYALNNKINELGVHQDLTLIDLVKANAGEVSEYARIVYNHHHFFSGLLPLEKPYPRDKEFCRIMDDSFGSFERFKTLFKDQSMNLFGSGWIFLAAAPDGSLHVITTENNGNPHQIGYLPLLTLDLWEHAYYSDYRNDRGAYIDSFWQVVDWALVCKTYRDKFWLAQEKKAETENTWIPADFQYPPK